jgi:hypothetical protein
MAEDSSEQVRKKLKTGEPAPTGSTVVNAVLGKLRELQKLVPDDADAVLFLSGYFEEHGSALLEHYDDPSSDTLSHLIKEVKWPDDLSNTSLDLLLRSLLSHIKAAKETTDQEHYTAIRKKVCGSVVTNVIWDVNKKLESYSLPARSWKVGRDDTTPSLEQTTKALARRDGSDKQPQYIAFVGSSGSGKTTAMIYSALNECNFKGQSPGSLTLTVYLESGAKRVAGAAGTVQTTTPVEDLLGYELNDSPSIESMFYGTLRPLLREANPCKLQIPDDFWETTTLVLALDEVPNHWTHEDFVLLSNRLRDTFGAGVVLMVASTALSESVLKQPTSPVNMVKVRMLPVQAPTATTLFNSRLNQKFSKQWFQAFSLLPALLTNQRCAEITANTIVEIIGALADLTPEDKAVEHFASMSSFVMLKVAQQYLNMNGIKGLDYKQRIRLMAASLGLVSMQRVVQQGGDELQRDAKDTAHKNEASNERIHLCSKGLVDREMVGDGDSDGDSKNTNCFLEWSMSPALTLVCAVTLAPWFAEINHEPDKLEVLSCIQWLAIRFIQTQKVWKLQRLQQAVPRTGNDSGLYQVKGDTESSIFLNGPLAAFGDVVVKAVPPHREDSKPPQEGKSTPATPKKKSLSPEEENAITVANVASPRHSTNPDTLRCAKIVQAKHTFSGEAVCNVVKEMVKAGILEPNATMVGRTEDTAQLVNKKSTRRQEEKLETLKTSYHNGRCLTGPGSQFEDATMVFVTNAVFTKKDRTEMLAKSCTVVQGGILLEFGAPAWQSFYPFSQLCRPTSPSTKVEREKYEGNNTAPIPVISTSGTNARQAGQVG